MRLVHVMLPVADLDRAIAFYAALGLGLLVRKRYEGFENAYVGGKGAALELACEPGRSIDVRTGHVAFEVEDIEAACARVLEAGGTVARAPAASAATTRVFAYVADPDGNVLELLAMQPA